MSLSKIKIITGTFCRCSRSSFSNLLLNEFVSSSGSRIQFTRHLSISRLVLHDNSSPLVDDSKQKFTGNKIMTVPNALCLLRISLTPVIGYLVVQNYFMTACVLFTVAGITDLLDGYIARKYESQRSLLGSVLDPIADKFLVSTLFVTLTYVDLISVLLTAVVLLRDILLIIGGFIRRYQMLEPPFTFKRYFDPAISSVQVFPTLTSKVNTALQLSLVTFSLASPVFDYVNHPLLSILGIVTFGTTIISGLQYIGGGAIKPVGKKTMDVLQKIKKK